MKRSFLLYIIAAIFASVSLFAAPKEPSDIEGMKLAQVMGIDVVDEGVRLSVCTAGDEPERLSADGESISDAMKSLDARAAGGGILYGHVSAVFISEATGRQGLEDCIDYFCISDRLRMDIPLYIIRTGSAGDAIDAGSESIRSGELAENILNRAELNNMKTVRTVSELKQSLLHSSSALVCALRCTDSADGSGTALVEDGLGIVRNGVLAGFISERDTAAAELLMGSKCIFDMELADRNGTVVSLEVSGGKSSVKPEWDEGGALTGMDIELNVSARIIEGSSEGFYGGEADVKRLLEQSLSARAEGLLRRSLAMGTDFLNLRQRVEMASPEKYRNMSGSFQSALGNVEIRLSVNAEI